MRKLFYGCLLAASAVLADDAPTAQLRSASFVTLDLDASVAFYTTYLGYQELGRSEITADKSRQVVGATGNGTVRYVSLAPSMWTREDNKYAGVSFVENAQRGTLAVQSRRRARIARRGTHPGAPGDEHR